MNGRLTWLPSALKDAGLRVNVVGGWEVRGRPTMHPKGLVLHHTAARTGSNAPSLRVCIDGRSDLPGPLCHILVGRDLTCHVIASGVAHHAGVGSWRGLTGNAAVIGVECENNGTSEHWTPGMVDAMVRISATCANAAGFAAEMVCGHKEWAPQRKIDPHTLSMNEIRRSVATLLRPPIESQETDEMYPLIADLYELWRKDPLGALNDFEGLRFWLRHGKAVGEEQLLLDLTGALAHAAGF